MEQTTINETDSLDREIVITKKSNNTLAVMKIKRVENGVRLYLQSPILEKFFATNGVDTGMSAWNGIQCYGIRNIPSHEDRLIQSLSQWRQNSLIPGGMINLSFIRAVGLGSGLEFTLPIVCSKVDLKNFKSMFTTEIKRLYNDYMRPINMKVEMILLTEGDKD